MNYFRKLHQFWCIPIASREASDDGKEIISNPRLSFRNGEQTPYSHTLHIFETTGFGQYAPILGVKLGIGAIRGGFKLVSTGDPAVSVKLANLAPLSCSAQISTAIQFVP